MFSIVPTAKQKPSFAIGNVAHFCQCHCRQCGANYSAIKLVEKFSVFFAEWFSNEYQTSVSGRSSSSCCSQATTNKNLLGIFLKEYPLFCVGLFMGMNNRRYLLCCTFLYLSSFSSSFFTFAVKLYFSFKKNWYVVHWKWKWEWIVC